MVADIHYLLGERRARCLVMSVEEHANDDLRPAQRRKEKKKKKSIQSAVFLKKK